MRQLSDEEIKYLIDKKSLRELLYCENKLVRVLYDINSEEATEFIEKININFPNYSKYIFSSTKNMIGDGLAYREPYISDTISLYVFDSLQDEIHDKFGVQKENIEFKNFFSLKFDLSANTATLKIYDNNFENIRKYFNDVNIKYPYFYGMFYNDQKQLHNEIDIYLYYNDVMNLLRQKAINNHLDETILTETKKQFSDRTFNNAHREFSDICSVVVDTNTRKIKKIKKYKIFNNQWENNVTP